MLDQQPVVPLASSTIVLHPDEDPTPVKTLSIEGKLEVAPDESLLGRLATFGLPIAAVPQLNRAPAVFAFGDCAFKITVIERVILNFYRQPLVARIKRWPLGYSPRLENTVQFETKVVVQSGSVMLLNHKAWTFRNADLAPAARLRGFREITLCLIFRELALTRHECQQAILSQSSEVNALRPRWIRAFGKPCLLRSEASRHK